MLAWAVSSHKVQGLSQNKAVIDLGSDVEIIVKPMLLGACIVSSHRVTCVLGHSPMYVSHFSYLMLQLELLQVDFTSCMQTSKKFLAHTFKPDTNKGTLAYLFASVLACTHCLCTTMVGRQRQLLLKVAITPDGASDYNDG